MEHEIIYTEDCALIVSELTSPGKEGQVFLTKENIIHTVVGWNYGDRLIIGHRPFTDAAILEGVPLLPEFNKQDDVEELAKDVFPYLGSERVKSDQNRHTDTLRNGFKTGYNKAKETYKYTEEDVIVLLNRTARKYFNEGREHKGNMAIAGDPLHGVRRELISMLKSLQQPKRPKYFECEMEPKYKHIGAVKGIYGSGFRKQNLMYGLPKTITNSQGQKELVGSYIY
jgi:hypothetical protein